MKTPLAESSSKGRGQGAMALTGVPDLTVSLDLSPCLTGDRAEGTFHWRLQPLPWRLRGARWPLLQLPVSCQDQSSDSLAIGGVSRWGWGPQHWKMWNQPEFEAGGCLWAGPEGKKGHRSDISCSEAALAGQVTISSHWTSRMIWFISRTQNAICTWVFQKTRNSGAKHGPGQRHRHS